MPPDSSQTDNGQGALDLARQKLAPRKVRDRSLAAVAAAAFFALAALVFAAAAVLAPPLVVTPAARVGVR
jgi:hypothetical protein